MPRQICKKPMRKLLLVKTMKRKGGNSSFESTFYSPIRDSTGLDITGIVHGYILYKSLEMKKSRKEVIFFNKNLEFSIYIYICPLLLAKTDRNVGIWILETKND